MAGSEKNVVIQLFNFLIYNLDINQKNSYSPHPERTIATTITES